MAFKGRRCKAISKSTGRRCKQPAMKDGDVCRFHFSINEEDCIRVDTDFVSLPNDRKKGAQPGNENAVSHGAYSSRLLPEEEDIYLEKKNQFTQQLGKVDVFDDQVLHILSLISAKLDVAAGRGAPAEALIPISNEILKLLRSLKETRDSRDPDEGDMPKSAADFLLELNEMDEVRGITLRKGDERKRIIELEQEINELRKKLKMSPREDISHKNITCDHCRHEGMHFKNQFGDWVCQKCGFVTIKATEPETASVSCK